MADDSNRLVKIVEKILADESFTDYHIIAKHNEVVRFHSCFMAVQSPHMKERVEKELQECRIGYNPANLSVQEFVKYKSDHKNMAEQGGTRLAKIVRQHRRILEEELCWDAVIIGSNKKGLRCHCCFLAVQSPLLDQMMKQEILERDYDEYKPVELNFEKFSEVVIEAFLRFSYYDKQWKGSNLGLELLKLALKFEIPDLLDASLKFFLEKGTHAFDVNMAFELWLIAQENLSKFENLGGLKAKSMEVMSAKYGQLKNSDLFRRHVDNGKPEVLELKQTLEADHAN